MANKKIEKELYGPSITEVALGAVLGLLVGVAVAGVYLVFKPVMTVKQLPKEISRSTVYFLPGAESNAKSKGWQDKQKQFIAGKPVQVSEEELNAWASSGGTPTPPPKPAAKPADKPKPTDKAKVTDKAAEAKTDAPALEGFIIPSTPNFRVVGDKLQIGMKCTLNWFGLTYDVTLLATGGFRKSGDQMVYVPDTIFLGSCPLQMLPAASGALVDNILSKEKFSDEMRLAWTKVSGVTIDGGLVKIATQ